MRLRVLRDESRRSAPGVRARCGGLAAIGRSFCAYASAGVKECWLVLGREKQIEVHCQPGEGQFAERTLHGPGVRLTSTAIPSVSVDWSKLLDS